MLSYPIRLIFRRNDLLAGIVLLVISFLPFRYPNWHYNNLTSLLITAGCPLGILLIANYTTVKLGRLSIISLIRGSAKNNRNFTLLSAAMGIILSFVAADLGGFWYYPYWSISTYYLIGFIVGGWVFYFLFLVAGYEAVKLALDRLFKPKKRVTSYYRFEPQLYKALLVTGVGLGAAVAVETLKNTNFFRDFHYSVQVPHKAYIAWPYWIMSFFSLWFVCEYIEYRRKRSSLIKDTIHGYFSPIIAVFIASLIMALLWELQNQIVFLWRYDNYPLADHTILNIPLFAILTWPLHIMALVTFWRAFGNKASSVVFANPKQFKKK